MPSSVLDVHRHMEVLRAALRDLSLEGIESELPALEEAAQHLRSLPREQAAAPRLREEFENLSADLRACQALIAHGLGFIHRWAGFLAASYTPGGEPAPLTAQGNVSVEG